jgi:hypothetical protein
MSMTLPFCTAILVGIVLAISYYKHFANVLNFVVGVGSMKVSAAEVPRFRAQRAQLLASSASVQSTGASDVEEVNNEGGADIGRATNEVIILTSSPVEPVLEPLVQDVANEVGAGGMLHVESVEAQKEEKRPMEQGNPSRVKKTRVEEDSEEETQEPQNL